MSDAPPVLLRDMDRTFIPYEDFKNVVKHVMIANYKLNDDNAAGDCASYVYSEGTNLMNACVNTYTHPRNGFLGMYVLRVQARLNPDDVEFTMVLTPEFMHLFLIRDKPTVHEILMNPDGPKTSLTFSETRLSFFYTPGVGGRNAEGITLRLTRDREGGHRYPFASVRVANALMVAKVFDNIMQLEYGRQVPVPTEERNVRARLTPLD